MLVWTRRHATYANVAATAALVLSITGGAYAAIRITGADVRNGSLTGKDIANASLAGKDVTNRSLRGRDVEDASIGESKLKFPVLSGLDFSHAGTLEDRPVIVGSGSDLLTLPLETQAANQVFAVALVEAVNDAPNAGPVLLELSIVVDGRRIPGTFSETVAGDGIRSIPIVVHYPDAAAGEHQVTLHARVEGGTVTITDRSLLLGVWPAAQ